LLLCEISGSHGGNIKTRAFWDVVQCSVAEVDRRFRGAYCLQRDYAMGDRKLVSDTKTVKKESALKMVSTAPKRPVNVITV
jgi:hypothetical protein